MNQNLTFSRPIILFSTLAFATLLLFQLFHNTASAATFIVTNTHDDGPGSLRQTISDTLTSPGWDQITFDPNVDGQTITLSSGQLVISGELDIDASDLPNGVSISGNDQFRVIFIESNAKVTLQNLTIQNGTTLTGFGACVTLCGGGVFAGRDSEVSIIDSQVINNFGNSAGGIFNDGSMTISGTLVSENRSAFDGGGIRSGYNKITITHSSIVSNVTEMEFGGAGIYDELGDLLIESSTIAYNRAEGAGGGIRSAGSKSIVINKSTFAHNTASTNGGGVYIDSYIFITGTTSTLTFLNSTISNNSANSGGGLYGIANFTTTLALTLTHSTVSENSGGGISMLSGQGGNTDSAIQNSIIAHSIGNNCSGISGDTHNLSDDDSCSGFSKGNPQFVSLAENGGETQTHALWANSKAFSLGDPSICQLHGLDQRGVARSAAACDAGSAEYTDNYREHLPFFNP